MSATAEQLRETLHHLIILAPEYDCSDGNRGLMESAEWREAKQTARKLLGVGETSWIPRK